LEFRGMVGRVASGWSFGGHTGHSFCFIFLPRRSLENTRIPPLLFLKRVPHFPLLRCFSHTFTSLFTPPAAQKPLFALSSSILPLCRKPGAGSCLLSYTFCWTSFRGWVRTCYDGHTGVWYGREETHLEKQGTRPSPGSKRAAAHSAVAEHTVRQKKSRRKGAAAGRARDHPPNGWCVDRTLTMVESLFSFCPV